MKLSTPAAILFALTFRFGTGSPGVMSKDQDSPKKPGRRLSSKDSKGPKLKKAAKMQLQPRNRNNILPQYVRYLPAEGKTVGKLLKEFTFTFTSYILLGDGEDYQPPFNQIYERCGPFGDFNFTDGIQTAPLSNPPYYTEDGSYWKGGCVGGHMEGELTGLYLSGAYTDGAQPSNYLNFHTFESDVYGVDGGWTKYPFFYNDWSAPGWPAFTIQKGSGWIYTDFCRDDGKSEWIHFFTTIININYEMFNGESTADGQNIYAMDVGKSRGCEGKYITFFLYNGVGYSNPKSREEGYIHDGMGCPPNGCSVKGRMYELVDVDQ